MLILLCTCAGGVVINVFGMGFGWVENPCSDPCLISPGACTPPFCLYMRASIGNTEATTLQVWCMGRVYLSVYVCMHACMRVKEQAFMENMYSATHQKIRMLLLCMCGACALCICLCMCAYMRARV